ncbi:Enolase-phosphatase E1 [Lachnellula hyalina]|uniref:Enolase-phosphatase E1 n=1 Tax=Lachnellula hyalina TaxID=1316788 RepID=A0A8H8R616_9HELO|nr:Enolase-phosphatase E1 [Lachnellula hyalina]TVY29003.1 Enolase-phosphatase E1 [Lachnellula hyalina]
MALRPSLTSKAAHKFPYALEVLPSTLATQWNSPAFAPYRDAFPPSHRSTPAALLAHVRDLMSQDLKIPYLKSLQGYLWLTGYESGALRCPLFPDVQPSMSAWYKAGIAIVIYSSGSVPAQKLLFQYTNSEPEPDLRPLISGYFDTVSAGLKTEKASYEKIAGTRGERIGKWLFLSDNVREVDSAREAGMQGFVVVREGNADLSEEEREGNTLVGNFEEIKLKGRL